MNTNSPGGLMALPKSPYLISTFQSDLFPMLMGSPVLDHVVPWGGMGQPRYFSSHSKKNIHILAWHSSDQTDRRQHTHTHTSTPTYTHIYIHPHVHTGLTVTEHSTLSSHLEVHYEKPGSSQAIMTCYIPFLAELARKAIGLPLLP